VLGLRSGEIRRLVLLGAHCDDIAIGAGGTVLQLCRARPGLQVSALVLTGAGSVRAKEEQVALEAICPGAELDVTVLDLPDGRIPEHWGAAKAAVEELRARTDPDLVLCPAAHDAHQDHRTLAMLVPTAFRNHLALGYEILKWDGDLAQPDTFVPLPEPVLREKVEHLTASYGSQSERSWFDAETFSALARVRGVQCQSHYAEGFHSVKTVLDITAATGG
jgi:LmbE family N-acetylglucosaminyl deacetylase